MEVLVTGGAGFFGGVLKARLLAEGIRCVSVDLTPDPSSHPLLRTIEADIRDRAALEPLFAAKRFDAIFHCAAILAHGHHDRRFLWQSNVEGTRNIADLAKTHGVPKVVFISSNCLWADPFRRAVTEQDVPKPREIYGESKWEGEKILMGHVGDFAVVVFRTPTIISSGRLGLLSILFEFIHEGRRVWVVDRGRNRYQFVYAPDLADACRRAIDYQGSGIFNVGSDNVLPFCDVYEYVIARAGTGARLSSMPRSVAVPLMRAAYALGISPLGPYQYRMIAEDFVFDTSKIKRELAWRPTRTNGEMLYDAYLHYHEHRHELQTGPAVSAHRQPVNMGAIRILKWLS
jgi:UDP-glucose 4-epimerase